MLRPCPYRKIVVVLLLFIVVFGIRTFTDWPSKDDGSAAQGDSSDARISDLMGLSGIQRVTEPWKAYDFTLKSLKGKSIDLSQYRGKVVLLSFWTTW
jgi:cytochrome oxidase Cu insertion factor (SCO1/SenC/PrrC family)